MCRSGTETELPVVINMLTSRVSGQELMLVVNRHSTLKSAQYGIRQPGFSFWRPVRVKFSGEDAEDEGGPKREFFRLISCFYD